MSEPASADPLAQLPDRPGPFVVVARGHGGAIGRDGTLPWHLPEDLAHFKRVTMGHHVIVGATTWASIGRPLPGRVLVVVSRRRFDVPDGVVLAGSPSAALELAQATDPSPAVAGGTSIYAALADDVVRIHLTEVDVAVVGADAFFAEPDPESWAEVASWPGEDPRLTFRVLDRA